MSLAVHPEPSTFDSEMTPALSNFNSPTATSPPPCQLRWRLLPMALIWHHIQRCENQKKSSLIQTRWDTLSVLTKRTVKGETGSLWRLWQWLCFPRNESQPVPFPDLEISEGARRVWEMGGQESAKQLCHWVSTQHSEYKYGCRHLCAHDQMG